jgi:hypothetical protein
MSAYHRVTRQCALGELRPELLRAVREHARQVGAGELDDDVEICCQTRSEISDPGRMASWLLGDPDQVHYGAVILTSQWLVWARSGDKTQAVAASALLNSLRVTVRASPNSQEIEIEVAGIFGNSQRRIRGVLAFGAEPAAQKVCDEIVAAVQRLNPQPKHKGFRIFGIPIG